MHQVESTRLWCTRLYLEGKEAHEPVGPIHHSRVEAADFEENIPAISKLVFSVGGFFGGYETRTYTLDEPATFRCGTFAILKPTNFCIE